MREEEFERLYAEHARPLLAFLVYRTGDRALAEDLLAETFERALRARFRFDRRRGTEKSWLYTIALNCLRDQLRREKVESRALSRVGGEPDDEPSERALAGVEERDRLRRALARLSEDEREAVALRYGADLTLPEIARIKREPLTTVEGRVYRALRKLRDDLT